MRKLTVLGATLLMSSAAFAGEFKDAHTSQHAIFMSDAVASEQEAQALGAAYIDGLNNTSAVALGQKLPTPHRRIDRRSMAIDKTSMEVMTELDASGNPSYFAQVVVGYSYTYRTEK